MFHNVNEVTVHFCAVYVPPKVGINNEDAFWPEIAIQTIMYLVSSNKCIPHYCFAS